MYIFTFLCFLVKLSLIQETLIIQIKEKLTKKNIGIGIENLLS